MENLHSKPKARRGGKRESVLDHAAGTLNLLGVSHSSLPAIAASIGVSRAALYYYFDDQEDLVFQSYRRSCEILAQNLAAAAARGVSSVEILENFIDGLFAERAPNFAAITDVAFLQDRHRTIIHGLYIGLRAQLSEVLAVGVARNELRNCSFGLVSHAILGVVGWIPTMSVWRSAEGLSRRALIDALKTLLTHGIACNREEAFVPLTLSAPPPPSRPLTVFDAESIASAKRETLLATASWIFNLKGVDATSLDEIAARVGVTKKVIYHNIGDKETLIIECYRRSFKLYEDMIETTRQHGGAAFPSLLAYMHGAVEANLDEAIAPLVQLSGFGSLPLPVQEELNSSSVRMMSSLLDLTRRANAEGALRKNLDGRATLAIIPGIFEWIPRWIDSLTPEERSQAPREIADLVRIGLLSA